MTIELNNVSKNFGRTVALDRVSLKFGGHKIYGLLGNNGAGKSTLLNVITSRCFAGSGEVTLDGKPIHDNDSALSQIFMLSEKNYFPESMKVKEAFRWAGVFMPTFDQASAKRFAERFELPLNKKIANLSTGYETIFKIVMALASGTPFLLLDEPVLGLDARHRDMFYKMLIELYSEKPCTIVISTHLISEVSNLIEHCVIIKDGRIIIDAPCEELLKPEHGISGPDAKVNEYLRGKNNLQDYFIALMNEEGQQ